MQEHPHSHGKCSKVWERISLRFYRGMERMQGYGVKLSCCGERGGPSHTDTQRDPHMHTCAWSLPRPASPSAFWGAPGASQLGFKHSQKFEYMYKVYFIFLVILSENGVKGIRSSVPLFWNINMIIYN